MAFSQQTPYEIHGKNYTATYQECIDFYKQLDEEHDQIAMLEMGMTDAGYPFILCCLIKVWIGILLNGIVIVK